MSGARQVHVLFIFAATLTLLAGGCAPSLHPLYVDYESVAPGGDIEARVLAAVDASPWRLAESAVPGVFVTERRTVRHRGIYHVDVSLEIAPVDGRYVRVIFHPYREYLTGKRRKLPYFQRSLRRRLLPELERAFAAQGLEIVGRRDRPDKVALSR